MSGDEWDVESFVVNDCKKRAVVMSVDLVGLAEQAQAVSLAQTKPRVAVRCVHASVQRRPFLLTVALAGRVRVPARGDSQRCCGWPLAYGVERVGSLVTCGRAHTKAPETHIGSKRAGITTR